jgi:CheY-like chemotaxis protein
MQLFTHCGSGYTNVISASPRTHVRYGGSGLGLFISRKLTELQGGAIGLKMGDYKGTTFAFYISACRPKDGDTKMHVLTSTSLNSTVSVKPSIGREPCPVLTRAGPDLQNADITLLVVEQNLVNQKVMCRQLRKKGYVVHSASHGIEALEFLEQSKFRKGKEATGKALSLILLDIEMPIIDGLTCIRKIRELEAEGVLNAHIPVISVSANARIEQIREATLAGMVYFISTLSA